MIVAIRNQEEGPMAEAAAGAASFEALRSSRLEHSLRTDRASFEVRDFVWDRPTRDEWTFDSYFIDLSLTPRPAPAWAEYVDVSGRVRSGLGRVMFVPPGRTLRSGAASGRQRSLDCHLAVDMIDGLLPRRPDWSESALADGLAINGSDVEWLLLRIYREIRQPGFGTTLVVDALTQALAVALIRRFGLAEDGRPSHHAGGLAPWRLRRIRERVAAERPAPRLGELAALCDMSVRHLTRAFKAETGQTIAAYVQQATAERARAMLLAADCSMAEIASRLGFSNATSFAYAFRRMTGLRPREIVPRRPRG
jgi:AraC family transcriptional regulator